MKLIKYYKGFLIKEATKRDISASTNVGDIIVTDRDNNIIYDMLGTVEEAQENIDGDKQEQVFEKIHDISKQIEKLNKKSQDLWKVLIDEYKLSPSEILVRIREKEVK